MIPSNYSENLSVVLQAAKIFIIVEYFDLRFAALDNGVRARVLQQRHRITMRPEGYLESEPSKFVSARISHYACWPPFS